MNKGSEISKRDGSELIGEASYAELLADIRARIAASRTKASSAVNRELIQLYWEIGREILRRQEREGWGAKVVDQLARDLKEEGHKGFSKRNLQYMATFARSWPEGFAQTASAQITWSHHWAPEAAGD